MEPIGTGVNNYRRLCYSLECRNAALSSHHKWECKLSLFLERTQLDRLPLIMMAFRAITQKPLSFFSDMSRQGAFDAHDVRNGVEVTEEFLSDDYRNLFNLVSHTEQRQMVDITTKYLFGGLLVKALKAAGYFDGEACRGLQDEVLVGRLVTHFMECMQFNSHMIDSVYLNRIIAPDSETRMWKNAKK